VEFNRLWKTLFGTDYKPNFDEEEIMEDLKGNFGEFPAENQLTEDVKAVCKKLNNTVILRKGLIDTISDGNKAFYVSHLCRF
jgi:NAD(P)H-hydrate repair Nnr-like enzyme with NAD(P)H-hydrate dehydratase domain